MIEKTRNIYFVCTLFMMIIIFLFSSQDSKSSNFLSYSITNTVFSKIKIQNKSEQKNEIINSNEISDIDKNYNFDSSKEDTFPIDNKTFQDINEIIRKTAHLFLYMVLGIFLILYLKTFNFNNTETILLTVLFCFLYACLDEYNQYLRGTRTATFKDSLIDTCGTALGCLIIEIKTRLTKFKKNYCTIKSKMI